MPWLDSKRKLHHHAAPRRLAVLAAACVPLAGCGEDPQQPTASPTSAASQTHAPPPDFPTARELDDEPARLWRTLGDMADNDADTPKDHDPAKLFQAEVMGIDGGPPEISIPIVYRHFDARYYLTLRITAPPTCVPQWQAGDVVAFHIHSPSRLFETMFGQPPAGFETRFALRHDPADGIKGLEHAPARDLREPDSGVPPMPQP